MSKIDLSSKQWCDLVFEGRNREYGAYKLRAEQGNRNKIALLVVIGLIILGIIIPLFAKFVLPKKERDISAEVTTLSRLKEAEVKDQHIKRVQPKPQQKEVQRIKSSIKFTRPVINEEHGKDIADLKEVITSQVEDTKVYNVVEQMPTFPGGEEALLNYISEHIKYPSVALEQGIQGTVMLRFVVTGTGEIGEVQIIATAKLSAL